MLSLRNPTFTNVFLLLHAVGYQIALALPAPWKIEGAQGVIFRQNFEDVGALQPIRAVAVHEEDAYVLLRSFFEERCVYFLVVLVGDTQHLMLQILHVEQILLIVEVLPKLNSE